jgi:hypothetical protein
VDETPSRVVGELLTFVTTTSKLEHAVLAVQSQHPSKTMESEGHKMKQCLLQQSTHVGDLTGFQGNRGYTLQKVTISYRHTVILAALAVTIPRNRIIENSVGKERMLL